jgi:membrane protein implicated in regulation of membrane protease activity
MSRKRQSTGKGALAPTRVSQGLSEVEVEDKQWSAKDKKGTGLPHRERGICVLC